MAITFNVPQILTLRDKICDGLVNHIGTAPEGPEFDRFVMDLAALLPLTLKYSVLYQSVSYLAGQEFTKKSIGEMAWRLAGNMATLKRNKVVTPWVGQAEPEIVPVQIIEADKLLTWEGKPGYQYKMRILAGSPCPRCIWEVWPLNKCSYIATKIGFTRAWKAHPFRDGHELVNMRFLVELDEKYCRNEQPGFQKITTSGATTKWNKALLMARAHINPPCPMNFTHHCYVCPVGYTDCVAGTHPLTYSKRLCVICNKDTWHDPGDNWACVACRNSVRKS